MQETTSEDRDAVFVSWKVSPPGYIPCSYLGLTTVSGTVSKVFHYRLFLSKMNHTPLLLSQIMVEAATHRSLHAAAFSCSSTHASAILIDLLARYIQLPANTAVKYAQHTDCTTLTTTYALKALDNLGFGFQDLIDYVPEAKDLSCYAIYSDHCVEELNELKAQLSCVQCNNTFPLIYAPYD
jgi:hypothetical protein